MTTISATNVPSILGKNPYETCWQLLENKIEKKYPFFGNKFTEHGMKYEKTAIKMYESLTGNTVINCQQLKKHPEYTWLSGKIDGMTHNNCIIEVKCPWNPRDEKLNQTNIPEQYWIQCQVYMNIFDTEITHYIELNISDDSPTDGSVGDLQYIEIIRDRNWWKKNVDKIFHFYEEMSVWNSKKNLDTHPIRIKELEWSKQFY